MLVKTILKHKSRGQGIVTISPEAPIAEAAVVLTENRIGALIAVHEDGSIAGILSERDIVRGLATTTEICTTFVVRELMTASVLTCREEDSVENLLVVMTQRRIRHLPVVDANGVLIGMITIGDLVKSRLEEADMEVDNLRHYVSAAR